MSTFYTPGPKGYTITRPWPDDGDVSLDLFSASWRKSMTAYVINEITISDPALYKTYADRMPSTLTPFGGVFLARGTPEAISARSRARAW